MKCKENRKCVQSIFFDTRGYFEISVFEITRVNLTRIKFMFFAKWAQLKEKQLCHFDVHILIHLKSYCYYTIFFPL